MQRETGTVPAHAHSWAALHGIWRRFRVYSSPDPHTERTAMDALTCVIDAGDVRDSAAVRVQAIHAGMPITSYCMAILLEWALAHDTPHEGIITLRSVVDARYVFDQSKSARMAKASCRMLCIDFEMPDDASAETGLFDKLMAGRYAPMWIFFRYTPQRGVGLAPFGMFTGSLGAWAAAWIKYVHTLLPAAQSSVSAWTLCSMLRAREDCKSIAITGMCVLADMPYKSTVLKPVYEAMARVTITAGFDHKVAVTAVQRREYPVGSRDIFGAV